MRLLVHALWQCNHEMCHGWPLQIELCEGSALEARREARQGSASLSSVKVIPQDFDAQLVLAMLEKIVDYEAFRSVARELALTVPEHPPKAAMTEDDAPLRQLHHALFEYHVLEATLVCPECGHRFPVVNGIPDFVQEPNSA